MAQQRFALDACYGVGARMVYITAKNKNKKSPSLIYKKHIEAQKTYIARNETHTKKPQSAGRL